MTLIPNQGRWGYCLAGQETQFIHHLDIAIASASGLPFRYLEIGLGDAGTFRSIIAYLRILQIPFEARAVDIPSHPIEIQQSGGNWIVESHNVGSESFLVAAAAEGWQPNFTFIDACHGAPCVTRDFLGVEKIAADNAVVAFHDISPEAQGQHFQPHCQTGINARAAVEQLGLLRDLRPGWETLAETAGTPTSFGCLYVHKI